MIDYIRNAFRYGNTLVQLVVINVVVYLLLIFTSFTIALIFGNAVPANYELIAEWVGLKAQFYEFIKKPWGLFTYSFVHGINPFHVLFNMLFFYWMGYIVQEYIGSRKLLNIYIIGGIFAGLIHITSYAILSTIGSNKAVEIEPLLVGASAAIFAVAFAAMTLVPEQEMMLFGVIPIRIKYLVWLILFFSSIPLGDTSGRILIGKGISHLAGALIGYLYIKLLRNGTDLGSPLEAIGDWWTTVRTPKEPPRVSRRRFAETTHGSARGSSSALLEDPSYFPDQDEVDAILDKINNSGYESLTKEEKQKLFRASQKQD
jgi:membrane associated rhomboid family serine protease